MKSIRKEPWYSLDGGAVLTRGKANTDPDPRISEVPAFAAPYMAGDSDGQGALSSNCLQMRSLQVTEKIEMVCYPLRSEVPAFAAPYMAGDSDGQGALSSNCLQLRSLQVTEKIEMVCYPLRSKVPAFAGPYMAGTRRERLRGRDGRERPCGRDGRERPCRSY